MAKLTAKQQQWLIATHVIIGSLWFGTALSMVLISVLNRNTTDGTALYTLNTALKYLDDFVVIPTASLSLLTGAILCALTVWGFLKHYWVIAKWIATVTLIVTGTIWLGPWVNAMTAISEAERSRAWENPLYVFDQKGALIGGAIQTVCILGIIVISFVKPWGRRLPASKSDPES
ncbi:MAG: hypothetical protein ACFCU8_00380 [Thermosynechococcaceae cyanobacterium]